MPTLDTFGLSLQAQEGAWSQQDWRVVVPLPKGPGSDVITITLNWSHR